LQQGGVQHYGVDDGTVLDVFIAPVEGEGGPVVEAPADAAFELVEAQGRFGSGVWIAGIPQFVLVVVVEGAAPFVRAGLGKDLDAAEA
jgi:hypothetical protein